GKHFIISTYFNLSSSPKLPQGMISRRSSSHRTSTLFSNADVVPVILLAEYKGGISLLKIRVCFLTNCCSALSSFSGSTTGRFFNAASRLANPPALEGTLRLPPPLTGQK